MRVTAANHPLVPNCLLSFEFRFWWEFYFEFSHGGEFVHNVGVAGSAGRYGLDGLGGFWFPGNCDVYPHLDEDPGTVPGEQSNPGGGWQKKETSSLP